jgi:hypothetical protein
MREPNFDELRKDRARCRASGRRCRCTSFACGIHPNPRFYKYHWWVFWNESPVDGYKFLTKEYCLSTAAAIRLVDRLKKENEPCWLYNARLPRLGSPSRRELP